MNAPTKIGVFALGLVAAFGAAVGIGSAVGPIGAAGAASEHDAAPDGHSDTDASSGDDGGQGADSFPGGLMVSEQGYTLAVSQDDLPAGEAVSVGFRVLGPDGEPITEYDETHDKDLHLIVVRRDLSGFQHVHPELSDDGTWSTDVALTAGEWRMFADFAPAGHGGAIILGADVSVAGGYQPQALPPAAATDDVDGYVVTLDGELIPGQESELTLSVSRDGQPVTDLQPYLAAYGHLVVPRDGDLAYLHVHPAGQPDDGVTEPGPGITFYATVPSVGEYRLFLDFQHDGVVRTAEFTARADGGHGG